MRARAAAAAVRARVYNTSDWSSGRVGWVSADNTFHSLDELVSRLDAADDAIAELQAGSVLNGTVRAGLVSADQLDEQASATTSAIMALVTRRYGAGGSVDGAGGSLSDRVDAVVADLADLKSGTLPTVAELAKDMNLIQAALKCDGGECINPIPTCEGRLDPPKNGRVEVPEVVEMLPGMVSRYYCDDAYFLDGAEARTCLLAGDWSHSAPVCEECPEHCKVCSDKTACKACDPNYQLDSDQKCQASKGALYIFSGIHGADGNKHHTQVEVLRTAKGPWKYQLPQVPAGFRAGSANMVAGRIVLVGGLFTEHGGMHGADARWSIDPKSDSKWTEFAHPGMGFSWPYTGVYNDRLFVYALLGGMIYDPAAAKVWASAPKWPGPPRHRGASTVVGNEMYLIGGQKSRKIDVLDMEAGLRTCAHVAFLVTAFNRGCPRLCQKLPTADGMMRRSANLTSMALLRRRRSL